MIPTNNINPNPQQAESPSPTNNPLITMMENIKREMATNDLALQTLGQSMQTKSQSLDALSQTLQINSQILQAQDQSEETQNQRLEALDQALQNKSQRQETQNQKLTESLVQLSTDLDRNNKWGVVILEGLDEIHSNQQGTLWIMNGIARLFRPLGRRPTPITPPPLLSPPQAVVIEVIPAEANHLTPRALTASPHGRIVHFFLWISAPTRWVWHCMISLLCNIGLKRHD